MTQLHSPALFNLEALGEDVFFLGWSDGSGWNGWATPSFELAEAHRIAQAFNQAHLGDAWYDPGQDGFFFAFPGSETESYPAAPVMTQAGSRQMYAIGSGAWIWSEVSLTLATASLMGWSDFEETDTGCWMGLSPAEQGARVRTVLVDYTGNDWFAVKAVYQVFKMGLDTEFWAALERLAGKNELAAMLEVASPQQKCLAACVAART